MSEKESEAQLLLPDGFTVTAHSGCMELPDNSIEAVEAGIEAGADCFEVDLRYDGEGRPVLSHDKPAEDAVPLDAVFALLERNPSVKVNIDVKDASHLEAVGSLAEEFDVSGQFFFTGVDEDMVPAVREKCPGVPYYLNAIVPPRIFGGEKVCSSLVGRVKRAEAVGLNAHYFNVTAELVERFHRAGLKVSVWTVNDEADVKRMLSCGVDNITTRRPDLVCSILGKSLEPDVE
ncbi:MAG: glycerophosphodiester phosphodiesterase [Clostridia bacterium]|nr:glycerophosphodiester phosphodiesterase [Clostridia bacterium]